MGRLFLIIWMTCGLLPGITSCSTGQPDLVPYPDPTFIPENEGIAENKNSQNNDRNEKYPMGNILKITIGAVTFIATLENNEATAAFKRLLPMTVDMSDLNNNEKYSYLPAELPTAPFNPVTIRSGDMMLYGSSCLVLFYETFPTSYSYTRLGQVDKPSGLIPALGLGNVNVTFELEEGGTTHIRSTD